MSQSQRHQEPQVGSVGRSQWSHGTKKRELTNWIPMEKELDIAHIASVESSSAKERTRKWITHDDRSSGKEAVINE